MRNVRSFFALAIVALGLIMLIGQEAPPTQAAETLTTVYWGPYTVAANDQTPINVLNGVTPLPCSNCYITSVTPELEVDTGGGNWITATYLSVPPARLHHMVLFNHSQVDATCAGNPLFAALGDRFFASGDERGSLVFPNGYGYYMPAASPSNYWGMQVMIHNLSLLQSHTYRLKMTFTYHPVSDNLKRMTHLWLDQNNCDSSQYPVPAGYDDAHWPWTSGAAPSTADDVEGEIMGMGGHVHDWGTSVAATLMKFGTGTETPICTSKGGYGPGSIFAPAHFASPNSPADAHPADALVASPSDPAYDGHIESMTGCPVSAMIAPGDMIHLHTQYVSAGPQTDVMGIMGAWVYDNCWNASNPSQDDFLDNGGVPGGGDDYGDACDKDADGDGQCNDGIQGEGGFSCTGTDADDDNDGFSDEAESGAPVCVGSVNDDNNTTVGGTWADDAIVNDGCPARSTAEVQATQCTNGAITDSGTTTTGTTATVLTDSGGGFTAGTLVGSVLHYTSGPASGQARTITANTATTITTAAFAPAPSGSGNTYIVDGDDDGDGWVNDGCTKAGMYSEGDYKIGTGKLARCHVGATPAQSPSWPADLNSSTGSVDMITLTDITSFLAPARRLDTNPNSGAAFDARWDLVPGRKDVTNWISLNDLTALLAGPSGNPPMFGGARAFGGAACTGA